MVFPWNTLTKCNQLILFWKPDPSFSSIETESFQHKMGILTKFVFLLARDFTDSNLQEARKLFDQFFVHLKF